MKKKSFGTFVHSAITNFKTVGAVAPSSRFLAREMIRPLGLAKAKVVVELGVGTGVMTHAMLEVMPADSKLLGFEISPVFTRILRTTITDPRFILIEESVERLKEEVERHGFTHADAVLSSLALGFFPDVMRRGILAEICRLIGERGAFTQFQYVHSMQIVNGRLSRFQVARLLRQYFRTVERKLVMINIPPAFVYESRGPLLVP